MSALFHIVHAVYRALFHIVHAAYRALFYIVHEAYRALFYVQCTTHNSIWEEKSARETKQKRHKHSTQPLYVGYAPCFGFSISVRETEHTATSTVHNHFMCYTLHVSASKQHLGSLLVVM